MRLCSVFFAAAMLLPGQVPELPRRWPLDTPEPVIRKTVQPGHFLESVGRRAALLGREDGTFEAWIHPIKLFRDFQLSVYFDGALEPVPLNSLAERVEVSPGRVTIVHSHAAFTIRQTWVASVDRPLAALLLDVDTARPLRLRASLLPEMKPMWPASFGGQATWFSEEDRALFFSEGLRRFYGFLASPAFVRSSEQVGHQMPDRSLLLEMDVTPEMAKERLIPIVWGYAPKYAEAREASRAALAQVAEMIAASDRYYREFDNETLSVTTPDPVINHAFRWAKYAMEKGWTCNDGVGCGLVAGWAASGASERPGFGWYFGGDALMNSWSMLDALPPARVRETLEFLQRHQRADGKIAHELTQSAALLDWSQYPYGYYHGDTTGLYLFSMFRYVKRTGDLAFLSKSWDSIERAYQVLLTAVDGDGLLLNRKAGAAAVETGALSGKVEKDVYLQGVWLAALDAYRNLAEWSGHTVASPTPAERLEKARGTLNGWFVSQKTRDFLPFGRLTDGSTYPALSGWQSFALAWGGLEREKAQRAAASLSRPELSTDWGTRLFATDSQYYDPLSYNDGSVWPFVTGFAIMAEYRNHRGNAGLQHLYGVSSITGLSGAGFIPEYLSGDRAQVLPRAVPHQLFSSSSVMEPLVSGLLGLDGDALSKTLTVTPHLPGAWGEVKFQRYRVGKSVVNGSVSREAGKIRVELQIQGDPLTVRFAPALPQGATRVSAATVEKTLSDQHGVVSMPGPQRQVSLQVSYAGDEEPMPELVVPQVGDRSRARR